MPADVINDNIEEQNPVCEVSVTTPTGLVVSVTEYNVDTDILPIISSNE